MCSLVEAVERMPRPGTRVIRGLPISAVRPKSWGALAWAVLTPVIALAAKLAIVLIDPAVPPLAFFLVAVLVTSLIAGHLAGILAAALGLLLAWTSVGPVAAAPLTIGGLIAYLSAVGVIIPVSHQYRHLLRRLQESAIDAERQARLVSGQNEVLEAIVGGEPLEATLGRLPDLMETFGDGQIVASVQMLDADDRHLRLVAGSNLPQAYIETIDILEIGPAVGSCGTAAYRKKPVYVTDLERDPLWAGEAWATARRAALDGGLKACWSFPIMSDESTVRGTLDLYHRQNSRPDAGGTAHRPVHGAARCACHSAPSRAPSAGAAGAGAYPPRQEHSEHRDVTGP